MNEAIDTLGLASEPSDSSVIANLHEAIDVINDHSKLPLGVWRPACVPHFVRDVVASDTLPVKRRASSDLDQRVPKSLKLDTSAEGELALCDALGGMTVSETVLAPAAKIQVDVKTLGDLLHNMCLCTER